MIQQKRRSYNKRLQDPKEDEDSEVISKRYKAFQEMLFAAANIQLQFASLVSPQNSTYQRYNKSKYRDYIQNPQKNEKTIREMSQFLARVSTPYKRILWYFASLYKFYWNLTPKIDDFENLPDGAQLKTDFAQTSKTISNLGFELEAKNILYFALRDGAFYGLTYENDESAFIHRLDPNFCKPVAIENGCLNFAFDFSYFKKNKEALETWDPMFKKGYTQYEKDAKQYRWQILDPARAICVKADPDLEDVLPFFLGIFESLLDVIDARTLQRNKDIIENYKLIVQKIPFFNESSSKELDDFRLDGDTNKAYSRLLSENVPDAVGVITTPMDIDTIDFKSDDRSADLVTSSMKQVFDDSGVSQLLFNSNTTGSIGIDGSIKSDCELSFLFVKQIERWVQRYIDYKGGSISFAFEFLDVNIFNKDSYVKQELSLANSGVPNKMRLAASSGMNPHEVLSSAIWENDILNIHETWMPLKTSYTMSDKEGGRPTNEEQGKETEDKTKANKDAEEDGKLEG